MRVRDLIEDDDFDPEGLVNALVGDSTAEARQRWQTVKADVDKSLYKNPTTGFSMKLVRTLPTADLCWVYVYDEYGDFVDGDDFELKAGQPVDGYFVYADQTASRMIREFSITAWKAIFGQTEAA